MTDVQIRGYPISIKANMGSYPVLSKLNIGCPPYYTNQIWGMTPYDFCANTGAPRINESKYGVLSHITKMKNRVPPYLQSGNMGSYPTLSKSFSAGYTMIMLSRRVKHHANLSYFNHNMHTQSPLNLRQTIVSHALSYFINFL